MSDTTHEQFLKLVAFVGVLVSLWLEPYAILSLWRWFVVPLGFVAIQWGQALGLNILVSIMRYRWRPDEDGETSCKRAWNNVAQGLLGWGLGWIVFKLSA